MNIAVLVETTCKKWGKNEINYVILGNDKSGKKTFSTNGDLKNEIRVEVQIWPTLLSPTLYIRARRNKCEKAFLVYPLPPNYLVAILYRAEAKCDNVCWSVARLQRALRWTVQITPASYTTCGNITLLFSISLLVFQNKVAGSKNLDRAQIYSRWYPVYVQTCTGCFVNLSTYFFKLRNQIKMEQIVILKN